MGCVLCRYDYEEVDSVGANKMMDHLRGNASSLVGRKFPDAKGYEVEICDDFSYEDPVDHSITQKQVDRYEDRYTDRQTTDRHTDRQIHCMLVVCIGYSNHLHRQFSYYLSFEWNWSQRSNCTHVH
jgi:hypothetical protein